MSKSPSTNTANNKEAVFVSVLKRHILDGRPVSANECPIALALKEKFNDQHAVMMVWYARAGGKTYRVSERAANFVSKFDNASSLARKRMKPFRFLMRAS